MAINVFVVMMIRIFYRRILSNVTFVVAVMRNNFVVDLGAWTSIQQRKIVSVNLNSRIQNKNQDSNIHREYVYHFKVFDYKFFEICPIFLIVIGRSFAINNKPTFKEAWYFRLLISVSNEFVTRNLINFSSLKILSHRKSYQMREDTNCVIQ